MPDTNALSGRNRTIMRHLCAAAAAIVATVAISQVPPDGQVPRSTWPEVSASGSGR